MAANATSKQVFPTPKQQSEVFREEDDLPTALPPKIKRYRVLEQKYVSLGHQGAWMRKDKIVSDEMGPGFVAKLIDQGVKLAEV